MRRGTKSYIHAELLNYQRSRNEIGRICRKLDEITMFPAYADDYTSEERMYLQDRLRWLRRITDAIAAADQDMDEEQRAVLRLKFWSQRPRPTDAAIAQRLNISTSTLYRRIGQIYRHVAQKLGMDL